MRTGGPFEGACGFGRQTSIIMDSQQPIGRVSVAFQVVRFL
jgi:hypothetical protein